MAFVTPALAGTRNSSMGPPHEGSIRRPIALVQKMLWYMISCLWYDEYTEFIAMKIRLKLYIYLYLFLICAVFNHNLIQFNKDISNVPSNTFSLFLHIPILFKESITECVSSNTIFLSFPFTIFYNSDHQL